MKWLFFMVFISGLSFSYSQDILECDSNTLPCYSISGETGESKLIRCCGANEPLCCQGNGMNGKIKMLKVCADSIVKIYKDDLPNNQLVLLYFPPKLRDILKTLMEKYGELEDEVKLNCQDQISSLLHP
jgi:hypothetical protein